VLDYKRRNWLGREGSNLRMAESKSAALPLGYAPMGRSGFSRRKSPATPVYRGRLGNSTGPQEDLHRSSPRLPPFI
jgi:hypothetical protein